MKPDITVIIPTFNRRESLRNALLSVFTQKDCSFEVLVIDDGSTDGTEEMIRQEFPKVSYAAYPNSGPSFARNRGIEKAQGKWVAFLDSDDEWKSGKLKTQLDFFENNPDFPICQTEEIWIRNGERVNPMKKHQKFHGQIFEQCLPLCIVSPSAVMIKKELFNEVGLFDEALLACEDYDLWLRIACKYPIGLINDPLIIKYGGHADQQSHKFEAMDRFRIQSIVKILKSGELNRKQSDAAKKVLIQKIAIYTQGAIKRNKLEEAKEVLEWVSPLNLPTSNETLQAP